MTTSAPARLDVLAELALAPTLPPRPRPSLPADLGSSPLLRAPLPLARSERFELVGIAGAFVAADVRDPSEHFLVCSLRAPERTCFLALPLQRVDEAALTQLGPAGLRDLVAHTDTCHLLERTLAEDEIESSQRFRHLQVSARRISEAAACLSACLARLVEHTGGVTTPAEAARLADDAAVAARAAAATAEDAARRARAASANHDLADGEPSLDEEILSSLWLYVGWRKVTRSLTTEQRERWADILDDAEARRHAADGDEGAPAPIAERWWREDFVETP